jgi:hypothetical protein
MAKSKPAAKPKAKKADGKFRFYNNVRGRMNIYSPVMI